MAQHYQDLANTICQADVPKDLKWLEGSDMDDYLHDISIINEYAVLNRQLMIEAMLPYFGVSIEEVRMETCVHNYIEPTGHRQGVIDKGRSLLNQVSLLLYLLICGMVSSSDEEKETPTGCHPDLTELGV